MSALIDFYQQQPQNEGLLTPFQGLGFVTAMAAAPNIIDPAEWIAFFWGGEEQAPFESAQDFEAFANAVVDSFNEIRDKLFSHEWQWPAACQLDEENIVTSECQALCEGLLQGWQLARDDWETLMPESSEDNALLGGVLLSLSLLFDPETAIAELASQGIQGLEQFEEIYNAMPQMLCGLTLKGQQLLAEQA
ncbi:UPF0149 family protein [Thaumasiovibrio subtropicus]|uniref:UPF0149 family protein n=1 Tax=Thaumasiovibrio subtropicus TaxID=1891207 RepID=UPI000B34E978|nr:UPF0149 family protein [Thaumasiovibrio subtropicus]